MCRHSNTRQRWDDVIAAFIRIILASLAKIISVEIANAVNIKIRLSRIGIASSLNGVLNPQFQSTICKLRCRIKRVFLIVCAYSDAH